MIRKYIGACGLAAVIAGSAFAADLPAAPPRIDPGSRFWISGEYLLWNAKGDRLPPLVTTSPPGTPLIDAGVLGAPGTAVLFGAATANQNWLSGGRVRAGFWLDDSREWSLELNYFQLGDTSDSFNGNSGATPILARPFFDVLSGARNSLLVSFPGIAAGQISASDKFSLLGGGFDVRKDLCSGCFGDRVSALIGYRYLRAADRLNIDSATQGQGILATSTDRFSTTNQFHGVDLGVGGEKNTGRWKFEWLAKIALGATLTDIDIDGSTAVSAGGAPVASAGGVLALSSNIGRFNTSSFAVVPEIAAKVGYQITPQIQVFAGYSFLYWSNVVRPGGVIDTGVNTNLLPPAAPGGPARPAALSNSTDFWAHGINAGLAARF